MKLLLGSCAISALLAGAPSVALAQVAVGDAPIHAVPASDAQQGAAISGPAAPPPAQPIQLADAAPSETSLIASLTPPPVVQPAILTPDEAAFFTTLGHRVTDSATAYDGYVRHAAAIDPGFNDPASVQRAVRVAADYQPDQLQQGLVAYAAMIALRSPAFVEGVRAQAQADPDFADRLTAQPAAVLQIPGAAQAATDVAGVLRAHGIALQSTGRAIGEAAYAIQAQSWSKAPVTNPVEVLAGVKAGAAAPRAADAPSEKRLLQSLVGAPRAGVSGPPSATPAVVRGMAVAALAVMGRAGDKEDLRVATLLRDALSAECLKLAMMNMDQCLAAAGPHYDDVFCVGEHAVGETARCVSTAADGGGALAPEPAVRFAATVEGPDGKSYGPEAAAAYGYGPRPGPDAAPAPQQVAYAGGYPEGDGTLDGQIYARRAQPPQAAPQPSAADDPPQAFDRQNYAPRGYAYQDAPAPRTQRVPSAYGYPYGPPGGGYAPDNGDDGQAPAYDSQAYPNR